MKEKRNTEENKSYHNTTGKTALIDSVSKTELLSNALGTIQPRWTFFLLYFFKKKLVLHHILGLAFSNRRDTFNSYSYKNNSFWQQIRMIDRYG